MLQSSSNRHSSKSNVQRRLCESGLHGRIAAKKPLLKESNNKKRRAWAKKHKQWTLDRWKSVLWSEESKFEIFSSNRCVFVRCRVGEQMISPCVVPTVKNGGGDVMVWGCFAVDTVCDLFRIQGTLNQHGYHSILQRYAIPSGLRLVGQSLFFNRTMTQHTSRLCKGYLTKEESDGVLHQMIWPQQSPNLNLIEMVWDELDSRLFLCIISYTVNLGNLKSYYIQPRRTIGYKSNVNLPTLRPGIRLSRSRSSVWTTTRTMDQIPVGDPKQRCRRSADGAVFWSGSVDGHIAHRSRVYYSPMSSLKVDKILAMVAFQRDIRDGNILCFTETWLTLSESVQVPGFFTHHADRNKHLSGKKKGGGVCLMINESWCDHNNIQEVKSFCSPDLELQSNADRIIYQENSLRL
uniref:Transposase Tc1-like domain-containing protein n=1 Tax=Oncorhynchus kisutch TaxID=8019 RepID=A0A8C7LHL1_ONCKI